MKTPARRSCVIPFDPDEHLRGRRGGGEKGMSRISPGWGKAGGDGLDVRLLKVGMRVSKRNP